MNRLLRMGTSLGFNANCWLKCSEWKQFVVMYNINRVG